MMVIKLAVSRFGRSGVGFWVDATAAEAALGGTIEQYGMFGVVDLEGARLPSQSKAYNYDSSSYVSPDSGIVYSSALDAGRINQSILDFNIQLLGNFFDAAEFGLNFEGTAGDADNSVAVAATGLGNLLTDADKLMSIFFNRNNASGALTEEEMVLIITPVSSSVTSEITLENGILSVKAMPIPASAWLFGSALIGLCGARHSKLLSG